MKTVDRRVLPFLSLATIREKNVFCVPLCALSRTMPRRGAGISRPGVRLVDGA
ncbi:hypothetical protein EDWATA_00904 [Edwardsiella tarda ATCC 23685]|uniref:Uncharacterized protein n=1 Tax=Edwardsiella tarda ATCC 23685 TaxID=500638 RepID=D4F2F5_EDWTA|nr:hypothetical protein EDWATA_00904 [Edwardsiella tarda ATCC 23685]